jgi:hypothetical protein
VGRKIDLDLLPQEGSAFVLTEDAALIAALRKKGVRTIEA